MRVPREIDELMWTVAEQNDPSMIDQFRDRYPQYSEELYNRMQIVSNLRGSRPKSVAPQFVPSENLRQFGPSRLAVAGVAVLVLVSVTFAAYATVQFVNSKRAPQQDSSAAQDIVFSPPKIQTPEPTAELDPNVRQPENPDIVGTPAVDQVTERFDPYKGKVTIESDDTMLSDAIVQIATKSGLNVTIAPGFVDKRIKIRFVNQPAIDILNLLGDSFGFTAIKEGKVDLLIVPAINDKTKDRTPVEGSVGTDVGTEPSADLSGG